MTKRKQEGSQRKKKLHTVEQREELQQISQK